MNVLLRKWMANREVSAQQAMNEIKARIAQLESEHEPHTFNAVAYLIDQENLTYGKFNQE